MSKHVTRILIHAIHNLLTKFFMEIIRRFPYFNLLTWHEVLTKLTLGILLDKWIWLVTSSTWPRDLFWIRSLVYKLHISHVTKVMSKSIFILDKDYHWSKFQLDTIYGNWDSRGEGVYTPLPSTNYIWKCSSTYEGLITCSYIILVLLYIYIYIYIYIIYILYIYIYVCVCVCVCLFSVLSKFLIRPYCRIRVYFPEFTDVY